MTLRPDADDATMCENKAAAGWQGNPAGEGTMGVEMTAASLSG
jgi:hypothetical protein